MQTISPFLWFDARPRRRRTSTSPSSKTRGSWAFLATAKRGRADRIVMTVTFELNGEAITALNGGPEFSFSAAISLYVSCDTQDEVDYLWEKLTEDGEPGSAVG